MFGWFHRSVTRREFVELQRLVSSLCIETSRALTELRRKDREMANDLTRLTASVTALEEKVNNLPLPEPDKQPEIDALADRVDAATAKLPAPPVP